MKKIQIMTNNFSTNLRGSHWSYLFLNKCHGKFYHFDSIIGLKLKHAKQLTNNIGLNNCEIYESHIIEQKNNFECRIHLLVIVQYNTIVIAQLEKSHCSNFEDVIWAGNQLTNK